MATRPLYAQCAASSRLLLAARGGRARASSSTGLQVRASSLAKAEYWHTGGQTDGSQQRPFIIGVAGGTACGKTSVCSKIIEKLQAENVDCFYKDLLPEEMASIATHNFDHPSAFDFSLIKATLLALRSGQAVDTPIYDFVTSARCAETTRVSTTDVILFDGILALYDPEIRDMFDMKIFVDTDADTRLARRVRRDVVERGRNVLSILDQYERTVKPSFDSYILPSKQHADIIIPRGAENTVAISLLFEHLKYRIQARQQAPAAQGTPSSDGAATLAV